MQILIFFFRDFKTKRFVPCFRVGTEDFVLKIRDTANARYNYFSLNPLKPIGYVMHQQFNIQQL